ncbi:MAG: copper resistance protein CopC [Pseudomonadota bacterium]
MKRTIMSMGTVLFATTALAHTHLESSVPKDKSKVAAPQMIELHFSEAARVTSLTLKQGTAAAKKLAVPTKQAKDVSVPVSGLTKGDYKVTWRVAGEDGHVMSGSFGFAVDPAAPAAATKAGMQMPMPMHDHALMQGHTEEHMKPATGAVEKKPAAPVDNHQH